MQTPFERYVAPAQGRSALWRLALGLVLIFATYLGVNIAFLGGLAILIGRPPFGPLPGATAPEIVLIFATFPALVLGLSLAVRWVHRRPFYTLLGAGWEPEAARAATLMALVYGSLFALGHSLGETTLSGIDVWRWLAWLPIVLPLVAVQTLAEELFFRAYLPQQLAARFPRQVWLWFGLPCLAFGAAHWQPDLFGTAWYYPLVTAGLFGLIALDLTRRSGNLGQAWGLHLVNNVFALMIVATSPGMTGVALRQSPFDTQDLENAPLRLLLDLVPLALVWLILRRRSPV